MAQYSSRLAWACMVLSSVSSLQALKTLTASLCFAIAFCIASEDESMNDSMVGIERCGIFCIFPNHGLLASPACIEFSFEVAFSFFLRLSVSAAAQDSCLRLACNSASFFSSASMSTSRSKSSSGLWKLALSTAARLTSPAPTPVHASRISCITPQASSSSAASARSRHLSSLGRLQKMCWRFDPVSDSVVITMLTARPRIRLVRSFWDIMSSAVSTSKGGNSSPRVALQSSACERAWPAVI
mmetsp:Transcript_37560/g.97147  ORF Transcript_37560/g.97147 Transcript_37560/m.97147 type:complete len:242 (+) Transcript_37560:67-792(+)